MKDLRLSLIATSVVVASATTVRGTRRLSECATVPTNQYCHLIDKQSQMALNVANGATSPGASVVQWEELADRHDNWRFEASSQGHYNLFAEHSGLSLVAQGSSGGANVAQGNGRDEWCLMDQGNGFYKVKHEGSGLFLDTVDLSHGANVILQSDSNSSGNQQWRINCFKSTTPEADTCESVPTNKYCHIVAQHSQMALNTDFGSTDAGGKVVQYWQSGEDHYSWHFVPSANGSFKIVNKNSNMGLFAQGTAKGASVVQMTTGDNWCMVDENDGYYQIKNIKSGWALDIYKVKTDPQTEAVIWEYGDGQANRKFRLDCDQGEIAAFDQPEAPEPVVDGCGFLDTCFMVNLDNGSEKPLTPVGQNAPPDTFSLAEGDQYTVRCDVRGSIDQFDFFYVDGGVDKRHSEWSAPFTMEYADEHWSQPVEMFKTCGSKSFRVSGKTWDEGKCFEASYALEAPC